MIYVVFNLFWMLQSKLHSFSFFSCSLFKHVSSCIQLTTFDVANIVSVLLQIKHLYRRLGIEQLSRFVGEHSQLSVEEKIKLSKEYMKYHKDGLELGNPVFWCIIDIENIDLV